MEKAALVKVGLEGEKCTGLSHEAGQDGGGSVGWPSLGGHLTVTDERCCSLWNWEKARL